MLKGFAKTVTGTALLVSLAALFWIGLAKISATDFERELAVIESSIASQEKQPGLESNNSNALVKTAYYSFHKSSLTGNQQHIEETMRLFDKAQITLPELAEFYLLDAAYQLKFHRLKAVKSDLTKLNASQDDPAVQILKADLAVQEGAYSLAVTGYQNVLKTNKTWDTLARLAYIHARLGDDDLATQLYQEAEEAVSAKDMRSYAWLELQRGYFAFSRGQFEAAMQHYQQADQAYSGYWLTKEYQAELLAAQGNYEAAIVLFKQVIICTQRPESYQALGDLYLFRGEPESANIWHEKALSLYKASIERGEVHYLHHLASFYADSRMEPEKAVYWAQRDSLLRQNVNSLETLAWSLYRNGQYKAAVDEMQKALSHHWQDAHLFFHAAMIYLAAGNTQSGKVYLQKASQINPHYDAFHMHR